MSDHSDYIVQNLEQLIEIYSQTEDTVIPKNLKEAVDEGWVLSCDALQLVTPLEYDEEQRKADKKRVVRLYDVLKVLSDMEASVVRDHVVNPKRLLKNSTIGLKEKLSGFISAIFELAVQIWNNFDWVERIWPYLKRYWDQFFLGLAATELALLIDAGMKSRDSYAKTLQRKALPQRNGQRYRRRKVTRK